MHEMLTAAFSAMADGVRNHASEFMPGGCCCTANITLEMRERLSGVPLTSVSAETMFARVKRRAEAGGIARHDTRMGAVVCGRDGTVGWARSKDTAQGLVDLARKGLREGSGSRTIADERQLKGQAKAPAREEKLSKKRKGRAKKASDLERLRSIDIVSSYKALKMLGNDALSDQLKIYKLVQKRTGFTTTGSGPAMRLQLQSLIFDKFGAGANDLEDGDSGLEGRASNDGARRKRKVEVSAGGSSKGRGKRKRSTTVSLNDWEWDSSEEYETETLIGKLVADGVTPVPGRTGVKAGTVLYKVLWAGFPPDIATWEEEEDIPCGEVDFVGRFEEELADGEAGEVAEESDEE